MTDASIRASDREREHSVETLREHAAQGRLTLEEFQQRMEAAYAATTRGDLASLFRDLPDEGSGLRRQVQTDSGATPSGQARRHVGAWPGRPRIWLAPVLALALTAGIVAAVAGNAEFFPWPLFALVWVFCAGGCRKGRAQRHRALD